jgi:hypothetical protein
VISQDLNDFKARTDDMFPGGQEAQYNLMRLIDSMVMTGYEIMELKCRDETGRPAMLSFQSANDTQSPNALRDWTYWLMYYRTLTLGFGRQAGTQLYVSKEFPREDMLVVLNEDERMCKLMHRNLSNASEDEFPIFTAQQFFEDDEQLGAVDKGSLETVILYTSKDAPVDRKDLFRALVPYFKNLLTARVLEFRV